MSIPSLDATSIVWGALVFVSNIVPCDLDPYNLAKGGLARSNLEGCDLAQGELKPRLAQFNFGIEVVSFEAL